MTVHLALENGAAKCGANVYKHYEMIDGKYTFIEKRVSRRRLLYFENAAKGVKADCKRCLNTVQHRWLSAPINRDMTGTVFHRSFGYDMTINKYCRVISQSEKSLLVEDCGSAIVSGDPYGPGGTGKAIAGNGHGKQFRVFRKVYYTDPMRESFVGDGEGWSVWDGKASYENHCD